MAPLQDASNATITTVIGAGIGGLSLDTQNLIDNVAIDAGAGIAARSATEILFIDSTPGLVRRAQMAPPFFVTTYAGGGTGGDGYAAQSASPMYNARGLVIAGDRRSVFISEGHRVRLVYEGAGYSPAIYTATGSGTESGWVDGATWADAR